MTRPRRNIGGFTLLELLVATAMTAVLAGSLYATLHIAFRARRTALSAVDDVRRAAIVVGLMAADLRSAAVPTGILAGGFVGTDAFDSLARESDTLSFHCTADGSASREGRGDLEKVEFACQEATDEEGTVLLRLVTTNLLATTAQDPVEEVLCRDVQSLNLRYFDGLDWLDEWDSGMQDNALPLAVEVTLQFTGLRPDAPGYVTSCVLPVPCSTLTAGLQVEMAP